ncbi:MAG: Daunorubicin resistance ABC transporter, inner membrane subunit B [Methanoculleus marisnigri]|uniref:Daunorubicin resistance ABC transporter, inner membrane subunit B n=1 Tax=Methanoculleus marisnigri TaxID=2198 RepID=A0A101GL39_9EURY|nr:MAG: Daunorubicin resistance ABC transporter, inner membrane subunit B [Methanoculleus marisnigri]
MDIVYTIWLRNVKRYLRSKSRILGSLGMPLFFMLVLGFGLNSIVQIPGTEEGYMNFIIPGIVAMSVLFTSVFSGIQIIWDKQFGFLKETLVAPVSRLEIMLGQTLGGATTAVIQGLILMVLALFIGLQPTGIAGFLIAVGFMALIGVLFTAFGIAIASRMEDMHGFQLVMNFVIFPIFGLSGALFARQPRRHGRLCRAHDRRRGVPLPEDPHLRGGVPGVTPTRRPSVFSCSGSSHLRCSRSCRDGSRTPNRRTPHGLCGRIPDPDRDDRDGEVAKADLGHVGAGLHPREGQEPDAVEQGAFPDEAGMHALKRDQDEEYQHF